MITTKQELFDFIENNDKLVTVIKVETDYYNSAKDTEEGETRKSIVEVSELEVILFPLRGTRVEYSREYVDADNVADYIEEYLQDIVTDMTEDERNHLLELLNDKNVSIPTFGDPPENESWIDGYLSATTTFYYSRILPTVVDKVIAQNIIDDYNNL